MHANRARQLDTMTITEQLQHAIEAAQRLPEEKQNTIAERILEEIEELEWDAIVSQPHVRNALARMADEILSLPEEELEEGGFAIEASPTR